MNNFAADLIDEPNDTFTDLLTNDEASRLFLLAHNDTINRKSINASTDDDESVEEEVNICSSYLVTYIINE